MYNKELEIALKEYGEALVEILSSKLIKHSTSGDLIKSLDYKVIKGVNGLILNLLSEPYLINVDKGRRPGLKPPPSSALIPWVKKKGIKIGKSSDKQAAFVIARSIGKKGIKPTNVIKDSIKELINNKEELLLIAREKDIIDFIEKDLNSNNIKIN